LLTPHLSVSTLSFIHSYSVLLTFCVQIRTLETTNATLSTGGIGASTLRTAAASPLVRASPAQGRPAY